jgi:hypothetical protein
MEEAAVPEYKIRYFNEKDGCTYCWDPVNKKWLKVCPVDALPHEIRTKVLVDKLDAELLLEVSV